MFNTRTCKFLLSILLAGIVQYGFSQDAKSELPRVHIVATGGTIAATPSGLLSVAELTAAVPEISALATISVEDFVSIGSSSMTPEIQFSLAQHIDTLFMDESLSAVIVTHGTDSLEETAYLVDLLHHDARPVVFTASQRAASRSDSDGPRNLLNAVRIAVDHAAKSRGVLLTLNDEIHAARYARKTHTLALDAFVSVGAGRLGYIDDASAQFNWNGRNPLQLVPAKIEPKVDLLTLVAGSDGHLVRAAAQAGSKGLVLEIFGRGNIPPLVEQAIREVSEQGLVIVVVSRTGGGPVTIYPRFTDIGLINGHDLDGLKARMLLIAVLGQSDESKEIQPLFDRAAGLN